MEAQEAGPVFGPALDPDVLPLPEHLHRLRRNVGDEIDVTGQESGYSRSSVADGEIVVLIDVSLASRPPLRVCLQLDTAAALVAHKPVGTGPVRMFGRVKLRGGVAGHRWLLGARARRPIAIHDEYPRQGIPNQGIRTRGQPVAGGGV